MLISCPICGEQVSDTTDTCVHCGSYLKGQSLSDENANKKIDFNSLPLKEQLKLENDFLAENYSARAQKTLVANQKKTLIILWSISIIVTLALIVLVSFLFGETDFLYRENTETEKAIILGLVAILAPLLIGLITHIYLEKRCRNASVAYFQGFSAWLDSHGYSYEVSRLFQ